ncbi:glycosyltransferase [Serpentinimonas maccroryi]|uniref:Glycosyltransferase n=1 Tax=Serpentinimonas maccroryi TaxID=1458426 RepID=A0A060NN15_9BURK|nr:glycosyltransferase family 4 protein [Serpentinimonas maccroryi]BAO82770.1 glycosyltransferase [Serpentinimonas maccroryi]
MRILVVSQYFWPENFRVNDLVKEWVQRGHQVTVLTGIPNYPAGKVFDAYRDQPSDFASFEGAEVVRVPMLPRDSGGLRLMLNYLSFVVGGGVFGTWRLRGKPADVIFVFEPSPVTVGLPAVWLGKIKNAPVMFWALDLWPETLAAIGVVRSPRVLGWVGHLVRYIYNRCTLVLGQSRGFLGSIARYCDDKAKIRYFPSWAEDVFMDDSVKPAPEVPEWTDGFTVVFAGNIGEAQDMPAVLDAAERLKDNASIRWVIVGDGRKSDWLQAEVARRGLVKQVLLPGRFPVERMPSFYAHADALLVSLKRDPVFSMTIPGKVQSYLMAGIPLLGMLDGEGAAVIRDAQAGLTCEAGDGAGLAQAVLALAAMPTAERKQRGVNGRNYAQQEFGRAQLMDRLEALLAEAVTIRKAKA